MDKSSSFSFVSDVVRSADGSLDVERTLAAFQAAVCAYEEHTKAERADIHAAIGNVLDKYGADGRLRKGDVVKACLAAMGADLAQWAELEVKILECLSDRSRYDVARGRAGGVRRV